jgi:hypothetical protein
VAVVQLSRIQIRRGQKNTGPGLPQLASGELGWAIDTRELYIGNGAVSEGSPAVGNTKILTELDDIFSVANTYTYRDEDGTIVTGPNSASPIERNLQERLDDRVSVRAFGARGNGSGDDTAAIQRAIDQLYLNTDKNSPKSRVELHIEAGTYNISNTLYIPPYATLKGAGSDKTVFKQISSVPVAIQTVNGLSTPGSYFNFAEEDSGDPTSVENQAKNILIEGITVENFDSAKGIVLENCLDSVFRDIKLSGTWGIADGINNDNIGIETTSLSSIVESKNNRFENCLVKAYSYAVKSDYDIDNHAFDDCVFEQSGFGVVFGQGAIIGNPGQQTGPTNNTISNSIFRDINKHGFWVAQGKYNTSENNRYELVGNMAGGDLTPVNTVVQFDTKTNKTIGDYFSRTSSLISGAEASSKPYVSEVGGAVDYTLHFENEVDFSRQLTPQRIFRLPGVLNQSYEIDYMMVTDSRFVRKGTLTVVVYETENDLQLFDEYFYAGENNYLESVEFQGQLRSIGTSGVFDTIDIKASSSLQVNDRTYMTFMIKAHRSDII